MSEIFNLKESIAEDHLQLEKVRAQLDRSKEETAQVKSDQSSLKDTLERNRKTTRAVIDKHELEIAELRSNLNLKDQRIITAEEEITLLRDKSGGATKALSKEKKRLEEIEDSLQKNIAAGKQRETQLRSEIEAKSEEIGKLERKNAEMVRRLHQFDLEKDEMNERETRLNNLLSEGNETYGALQNEMESLKSQYERRLRVADENRRECENSISVPVRKLKAFFLSKKNVIE